jgi:hypothetical protein
VSLSLFFPDLSLALENVYIVMYDWGNDGKEFNTPTLEVVQEEQQTMRANHAVF